MIENTSNIYLADKSIEFGRDTRFGIPAKTNAKKKIGPSWKFTPDAYWRHKNGRKYIDHFQLFTLWIDLTEIGILYGGDFFMLTILLE